MMTVKEVFALATKIGVAADPRGQKGVDRYLERLNKHYNNLSTEDKKFFDTEKLSNPYPDGFVHVDDGHTKVKRVMAGIDVNEGEILLASQLNERGKKIDLVIAHHPEGKGKSNLHEVMEMYTDIYVQYGVPVHIAEKLTEDRIKEIGRGIHPINHFQAINIAQHLGINFINTHTITDNLADKFVREFLNKKAPETVGEIVQYLLELPEYQFAKKMGFGPKIIAGAPNHRVGKMILEMTGGTNPSPKVYEQFSQFGVSTIVGMHMRDESMKSANECHMNIIIAGHMSSDSLGMNLWLDELEKRGIEIVPCGGLIRVSRVKKSKKN
ncbi:MAG: NGG1p interacting factor NIF3 [Candidatus Magasanikbacteria bacterium]|nr:NGG1p interacting factor NIF3 [Candidatus Magasanikbacteria bacterium]